MQNKVILISIDGCRPDGLKKSGNDYLKQLEKECKYNYKSLSMNPSVTFPCHFSMAHSVTPQRHGILSNTYIPQVRPIKGIFEKVKDAGGVSAMFYGWEELRDISRPSSLKFATYINSYAVESADTELTDEAIKTIETHKPDFVFLYMVDTDEKGGHDNGWMSDEYLKRISIALQNVKRIIEKFGDEYSVIIMADHGGHERTHGTEMDEDMLVPLFFRGKRFNVGEVSEKTSLLDIAPTIADVLGISTEPEWEGRSLCDN